ncbi:MAG: hypothetical protein ACFB8W_08360 [Elainellaceae cyanobacterium]
MTVSLTWKFPVHQLGAIAITHVRANGHLPLRDRTEINPPFP